MLHSSRRRLTPALVINEYLRGLPLSFDYRWGLIMTFCATPSGLNAEGDVHITGLCLSDKSQVCEPPAKSRNSCPTTLR